MKNCKGFGRIFSFTFRQQTGQRGYRTLTLVTALLCFVIPQTVPARLLCPWDSPGKNTGMGAIPFSRGST